MKNNEYGKDICCKGYEDCLCKICPENRTFVKTGKCTGCDECGKNTLCLITGEMLTGSESEEK